MLQLINNLPPHVVGVHAFADVTEAEYADTLIVLFDELLKKSKRINFILVLETKIKNFVPGMWCGSIKLGLKYFFEWSKVAVVSDQKGIRGYSDLFKYIIPGKFRSFPLDQLDQAVRWVDEK
jgi:hypothetical protein